MNDRYGRDDDQPEWNSPTVRSAPVTFNDGPNSPGEGPARNGRRGSYLNSFGTVTKVFISVFGLILMSAVVLGGYHLSLFLIDLMRSRMEWTWMSTHNPFAWIVSVLAVLALLGALRFITACAGKVFSFAFKFAQNDVVTMVIAAIVNILLIALNVWLTSQLMRFIVWSGVPSFYDPTHFFSRVVMFLMLMATLIWIPRTGRYGENGLGAAIDNNPRW